MCVAIPGTLIEKEGHRALIDFSGNRMKAEAGLVDVKPGDRVLVHAGCIIQRLSLSEAEELEELRREMESLYEGA